MRPVILSLLAVVTLGGAITAGAQQPQRIFRMGIFWNGLPQAERDQGVTDVHAQEIVAKSHHAPTEVKGLRSPPMAVRQ